MHRTDFLKAMTLLPLSGFAHSLKDLGKIVAPLEATEKMPALFLGHGNPMNAIEENEFVAGFRNTASALPRPHAILCISAHWETKGTLVTAMEKPKTIHDFGGFPKELFAVQYPAPGSPELAKETQEMIQSTKVGLDHSWGLDHGCWSVVKHLYPNADIPVIQISLDYSQPASYHYDLARQLNLLRQKGILIIGSGNMVHNLGMVDWKNENGGYEWANKAEQQLKQFISSGNHQALIQYHSLGKEIQLSIPTPEHYLPLLYALALQDAGEPLYFFNDKTVMGSISMTSLKIG